MKNRYLIWLNWPERPFRLSASDMKLFIGLVHGADVKAVRSERAFLRELPSATHAICWEFRREWFSLAPRLRVLATPGAGRELLPADSDLPEGVRKFHGEFHGAIMAETALAYMLAWCPGSTLPMTGREAAAKAGSGSASRLANAASRWPAPRP